MKPNEYKDMMKYLTRNKSTDLSRHVVDTLNKYEDGPNIKAPIKKDDPMTTWVKNNNANNANPGTYKRLVEEDEKAYKKSQQKKPSNASPDVLRDMLIEEMNSRDLDSDEIRYLMDTKDRSTLPKATPKQTAFIKKKVAANPAREQSSFIKHRQKLGDVMRNQKDKKVVLLNKPAQLKFDPTPVSYAPKIATPIELEQERLQNERERNFRRMVEENKKEKERIRRSGIGAFLGWEIV